ncbi:proline-rich domain-containing protein [Streptomyces dysideae]|uniref:Uncharacterized protein n=1 Tax=Streptomyces dysideae TaxID=909626 RepID=A0A124IFX8_9ACTN|nr:proline-rich domain-containing protein [Streptomyces dysideae]KUO22850.1 hypothetical protein AQJ91_02265 [Streptomyces dysideae]
MLWLPHKAARALFHPAWVPPSLDPSLDRLKHLRVIAGLVAALGVYTYVEGGFAFTEMMDNAAVACLLLVCVTPVVVGVMLHLWRRSGAGTVRELRAPLANPLKLLLLLVAADLATMGLINLSAPLPTLARLPFMLAGMWMALFGIAGAYQISGNFFGLAVVHRCLPPLLAMAASWVMALTDLVTGDLHGLGLALGVPFILCAPATVSWIALVEMGRLRRTYGIRLMAHPATLPPLPPPPPHAPNGFMPPQVNPYGPPQVNPQGNTYGPPPSHPYAPLQGNAYGTPYPPGPQNPYGPYNPQNPHGPYGG